jgi:hypothetical protein
MIPRLHFFDRFSPVPCPIHEIVRDAIKAGVIDGITPSEFEHELNLRSGYAREDYLQDLWDRI